jgi:predicted PurR-regulated permease PerM
VNRIKPILYLVGVALIVLIISLLFADILIYVVLSLIIATILRPLVSYLNKLYFFGYNLPKIVSIIIGYGILVGFIVLFVGLFVPLISEQIRILNQLDYNALYQSISEPIAAIENFLFESFPSIGEEGFLIDTIRNNILGFVQTLDFSSLLNNLLSFTGSFFVGLLAVSFISFFMLFEKGMLRRRIISIIPNKYFEVSIGAIYKIESLLSNYLLGLLFQMIAIFTIAAVGLSIFGVKYAITIAVFAAVANLIPYAGPLLGSLFGIIVGVTTGGLFEMNNELFFLLVKIVSVFATVQVTDNILLQPLIFSKSVKAHPLEIFVIIFAGASLAGVVGMIAAIPVYTVLRVIFVELYNGYRRYKIFQN